MVDDAPGGTDCAAGNGAVLLPEIVSEIPPKVYHWTLFGIGLAIGIFRMISQTPAAPPAPLNDPTLTGLPVGTKSLDNPGP